MSLNEPAKTWKTMGIRARVFIRGTVQGVFFRSQTEQMANASSVKGWIRNLSDGAIEAVFECAEENVNKLVEFCRSTPPGARVESFAIKLELFAGKFKDFQRRSRQGPPPRTTLSSWAL